MTFKHLLCETVQQINYSIPEGIEKFEVVIGKVSLYVYDYAYIYRTSNIQSFSIATLIG